MQYTIDIPDERDPCITAAREARNAKLPPKVPDPDNPGSEIDNPLIINDNATYVQFVMGHAAISYCEQYPDAPGVPAKATLNPSESDPALLKA